MWFHTKYEFKTYCHSYVIRIIIHLNIQAYDFRNRNTKYLTTELTKFVHQNGEFDEKSLQPHRDSGKNFVLVEILQQNRYKR